jgi:predicted nucleic acid-binding protein
MLIISDTSVICYLILINEIDILPHLFTEILIPDAVRDELLNEKADQSIRTWISNAPNWLKVQSVEEILDNLPIGLGRGECEAISLAVQLQADLVVIDDLDARSAAQAYQLTVTGTLGILYRAGINDLLDFEAAIQRLHTTSFRVATSLTNQLLTQYRQQKKSQECQ